MKVLWILLILALLGGAVALSIWDIPAPSTQIVKPLPIKS